MTGLSSAAQAVWRAYEQVLGDECVLTKTDMEALAAALRAVADQVVPEKDPWAHYKLGTVRRKLLDIADELEAQ